jgi:hypothetical protein
VETRVLVRDFSIFRMLSPEVIFWRMLVTLDVWYNSFANTSGRY